MVTNKTAIIAFFIFNFYLNIYISTIIWYKLYIICTASLNVFILSSIGSNIVFLDVILSLNYSLIDYQVDKSER